MRLELQACKGMSGTGLLELVEDCDADFKLLIDSCPNMAEEDILAMSELVKVYHG
jgi:hypothetical protein